MIDDFLVYNHDQEEHNGRLMLILEYHKHTRVTLNKTKCSFSVDKKFPQLH